MKNLTELQNINSEIETMEDSSISNYIDYNTLSIVSLHDFIINIDSLLEKDDFLPFVVEDDNKYKMVVMRYDDYCNLLELVASYDATNYDTTNIDK